MAETSRVTAAAYARATIRNGNSASLECSSAVSSLPLLLRVAFLAMASLRREVLGGYRRLMRVRVVAFEDDTTMLEASKQQLRIEFNKNKAVTDPSKIAGLIKGINEVEEMLKYNIAQARLNDRGNYAVNVAPRTPEAAGAGEGGTIEVEHIGGKAGDLPEDVTVTGSPCNAAAAEGGGERSSRKER